MSTGDTGYVVPEATTGCSWKCCRCLQSRGSGYWLNNDGPYCVLCWIVIQAALQRATCPTCGSIVPSEATVETRVVYPGTSTSGIMLSALHESPFTAKGPG